MRRSSITTGPVSRRRQRGIASVIASIWLVAAVILLGVIDIGNVFYQRRLLQGVADLAASAGVQVIDDACSRAPATAAGSAGANGFTASGTSNTITTTCGRWDSTLYAGPTYFAAAGTPANAVQVTVAKQVPYFFAGPGRMVTATATAQAINVGAFSIGTTTASVDPTVITGLLNSMLGTNINSLQISAAGYAGLAQSRIEIGDLVTAAGVGTVNQLLALNLTAAQIAKLTLTALQNTHVLNANLSAAVGALQTIVNANIQGSGTLAIGAVNGSAGLLQIGLADTQSALHATISPFDALMVTAEVAQAGKAAINVGTALNLGVATASLQVQIIQPPVLAVGEAGKTPGGAWRTVASSAQLQAAIKVSLGQVPALAALGLGSPVLNLPVNIAVAPGQAWLVSTQCASTQAASNSVVGVQTGIAQVCVGDSITNPFAATPFSCSPATLINVPNVLTITTAAGLPATVPASSAVNMTFDGISGNADDYQNTNSNQVGGVLYNATLGLATQLSSPTGLTLKVFGAQTLLGSVLGQLVVGPVLAILLPLLKPVFNALDSILTPILQLLGAQIGVSTVHGLPPVCGQSQLQY